MPKPKIIVGLTGSIGMGKSTVARMLVKCGASLFDADLITRALLEKNNDVKKIFIKNYPEVFHAGRISRKRVGQIVFSKAKERNKIENFLHPLIKKEAKAFIQKTKNTIVILEIPLLFETGFDELCDLTLCVSANPTLQKRRVMKRRRLNEEQYQVILKRQYSDCLKKEKADCVIDTSVSQKETREAVESFYKEILNA